MKTLLINAALLIALVLAPLSAATAAGNFKRSDYVSQEDVQRAGGQYKLALEGAGDYVVTEIRAPKGSDKTCLVDKKSLKKQAFAAAQDGLKHKWLRMSLITAGPHWICIGTGAGCYILIKKTS